MVVVIVVLASVFSLSLTLMSQNVRANTLFVGGSGPANYTTIQSAIDVAFPGDTIYVFSGTYNESIVVNKILTIMGEGRDTTIIQGTSSNVVVISSDWVNFTGFTISAAGFTSEGLSLDNVENCHVGDNRVLNSDYGIFLWRAHNNTIFNNEALNNSHGIEIWSSNFNTILGNNASNNSGGISISFSTGNVVDGNLASYNRFGGIYLLSSQRNILTNNVMIADGIHLWGDLVEYWNTHTIDTSNTVNGRPVHYWRNVTGGTIPSGAGQVILANTTNVIVNNQNLSHSTVGLEVGFSSNNTLTNITASSNTEWGIWLHRSRDNLVADSTITSHRDFGIRLSESNNNTISGNYFSDNLHDMRLFVSHNNTFSYNTAFMNLRHSFYVQASHSNRILHNLVDSTGDRGIYLVGSDLNTVAYNHVSNVRRGIEVSFSDGNTVRNNTVLNNEDGIYIWFSILNRVYHNSIIDNLQQGYDSHGTDNWWDNGYPSGGNYWSNYTGIDDCSGPNQNICPDPDGIGDTPYDFAVNARDNYPLMTPPPTDDSYELEPSPIAVLYASLGDPNVGEDICVYANVTNKGNVAAKNFTVTLFDDLDWNSSFEPGEAIGSFHVSILDPLDFAMDSVYWMPTVDGLHNICMFADSLDNVTETDETNNLACRQIEIYPGGPLTTLSVGQPNYTSDNTFITSATPLTLQAVELSGGTVAYTEYRVDGAIWEFYSGPFTLPDEGFHMVEYRSANSFGYLEQTHGSIIAVDNSPPESQVELGTPTYVSAETWIKSTTPFTLESEEPILSQSIVHEVDNIVVYQENISDGELFDEYLARSNHTVERSIWPGLVSVLFYVEGGSTCPDIDLGVFHDENGDGIRQPSELVDYDADADNVEAVLIEDPLAGPYIISIAGFTVSDPGGCLSTLDITQTFGGSTSSGLEGTLYRLWNGGQWSEWLDYLNPFNATNEGLTHVEYYSTDNLDNSETVQNLTVHVDDTPPNSVASLVTGTDSGYDVLIAFNDTGCGVDGSYYRMGDQQWQSPAIHQVELWFTSPGNYTLEYYAVDNLGNEEIMKTLSFEIPEEESKPTVNWKPLVAAVFTVILALAGFWTSKKRPWKGAEGKRPMLTAFLVLSMPFVLAEAVTGILSLLLGVLSIPPVLGIGMLVDSVILAVGMLLSFARFLLKGPVKLDSDMGSTSSDEKE
jgi:parallel beta-helix repeat protein